MKSFFKLSFLSLLVGIVSGMFASGGGLLLIPILVNVFKLSEKEARGTAVFCILPIVITTGIIYNSHSFIDYKTGVLCAIGGVFRRFFRSKYFKENK